MKLAYGLDISDHSAEVIALSKAKGLIRVERFGRTEIPAGLIRRGEIQDPDKLTRVLAAFLDQVLGRKRGTVSMGVSLPETQVYSKIFTMPAGLGLEMAAKAAAMETAGCFPVPLDNVVSDIVALSRAKDQQDLSYLIVQRGVAEEYARVLRRIAVQPLFFDSESAAIARALVDERAAEPVLIADIGAKTTLLAVSDRGVRFSSNIAFGGNDLSAAIEVQLNVPLEKAEHLKRRDGFDPSAEGGRVCLILQKPMTGLVSEMRRTIDFFKKKTGRAVGRIILAGGTSLTPETAQYVGSNFPGIEVVQGQPLGGMLIDHLPQSKDLKNNAILYATALGLALRVGDHRRGPGIDLLPDRQARGRGVNAVIAMARSAGLALISMVRRKSTRHPKGSAAEKKKKKAAASAPEETAAAAVSEEAASKIREPAVTEPPVTEPPVTEPPAEAEEPRPAEGVSSLLDSSRYDLPGETEAEPEEGGAEAEPEAGSPEELVPPSERGSKVLWIDSIIASNKAAAQSGAKKQEKIETESDRKPNMFLWTVLILFLVLIAAAGVYMFAKKTGFDVRPLWSSLTRLIPGRSDQVSPEAATDAGIAVPAAPDVQPTVSLVVLVGRERRPDGATPLVTTRVVETDVKTSGEFSATGQAAVKSAGNVATGTLKIINTTPESYTFVATTRCLSKEGVLFRLKQATFIPASGSVEAAVYADKPGPEGDIGPTTFSIPGLSLDLQAKIYAESSSSMTGGSSQAKGVSDEDLVKAKAALLEKLKDEAMGNLKAMAVKSEIVLPDLITSQELSTKAPSAGTAGEKFTMTLSVRFRALLLPQAAIDTLLAERMKQTLPPEAVAADYELGQSQYTVEAYDTETDLAEIRAEASVNER